MSSVQNEVALDSLIKYLGRVGGSRFYGNVNLRYSDGKITLVEVEQTLKPEAIANLVGSQEGTPKGTYDSNQRSTR